MFDLLILLTIAASPVRIAVLGDRTGGPDDEEFESALEAVSILAPDLVMNVGDLIDGYTDDTDALGGQWDHVLGMIDSTLGELPFVFVPGNHDITYDEAEAVWLERTGTGPDRTESTSGVEFIVWDTSRDEILEADDLDRLAALLEDVRPGGTTILATHRPFWMMWETDPEMAARLRAMVAAADVEVVIGGHIHTYAWEQVDGVHYITMGTSGGDYGQEDIQAGCFPQVGWLTLDGDEAAFALLDPRSVHPLDLNTVIEETLLYLATTRLLSLRPLEDALESASLTVESIEDVERTVGIAIDPGCWGFDPESVSVLLPPGGQVPVHLSQNPSGAVFPLPVLHVSIPYGDRGKIAEFDTCWPALRSIDAPRGVVDIDGTAFPTEYPGPAETLFAGDGGMPAQNGPMEVLIADSDGMLCFQSRMGLSPDGLLEDESFAVVLFADGLFWRVKVFPDGGVDAICYSDEGIEEWTEGWQAVSTVSEGGWEAEIGIDPAAVGASEPELRTHIYRLSTNGYATWSWPLEFDMEAMGLVCTEPGI